MSPDFWTYLLSGWAIAISVATIILNVMTSRRIKAQECGVVLVADGIAHRCFLLSGHKGAHCDRQLNWII